MDSDRATGREWAGLAVLALPTLLVSIDVFVLLLALPRLSQDLHASGTQQLWISDIYGFLLAGFLVTMGTLGDRFGRRRVLLTGAVAFGAASVLAAFSTSPAMLIAARASGRSCCRNTVTRPRDGWTWSASLCHSPRSCRSPSP